jgi:hypothetical protein
VLALFALVALCVRRRRRSAESEAQLATRTAADPYLVAPVVPFGAGGGAGSSSGRPSLTGARTLSYGKVRAVTPSADPFARAPAPASTSSVIDAPVAPPQEVHVPGRSQPELDHIVEQLASRFGWTTTGAPGGVSREGEEMLPQYVEAGRHL